VAAGAPALPQNCTSSSFIRTVCRHIVFVVRMIFTMSSKSVDPQSSRPKPAGSTQAWTGELRVRSRKSARSTSSWNIRMSFVRSSRESRAPETSSAPRRWVIASAAGRPASSSVRWSVFAAASQRNGAR
jgi:hypothetical protein